MRKSGGSRAADRHNRDEINGIGTAYVIAWRSMRDPDPLFRRGGAWVRGLATEVKIWLSQTRSAVDGIAVKSTVTWSLTPQSGRIPAQS